MEPPNCSPLRHQGLSIYTDSHMCPHLAVLGLLLSTAIRGRACTWNKIRTFAGCKVQTHTEEIVTGALRGGQPQSVGRRAPSQGVDQ